MADLVGTVLGGCELMAVIGRGGMGEVYRAHQRSLDRHVAVKVLPFGMGEDRTFVERFVQEARSIARLSHPNVVQVYDTGETEGYYYIVMELISGGTVKDRIAKGIPNHLEILDMMEQSATGLGAAHQQGIIHRDVKPGNIMYGSNRLIKVADFGLAKAIDEQNELTNAGEIVGTPTYMSPEQCEGRALDHRTDIYSLGATAFHYAAGKPPFSADTPLQVMYKHINELPEQVMSLRQDLPPGVSNIIDKCLAKDPYDRYQDTEELVMDLHKAAEGKVVGRYKPGEGRARAAAAPEEATSVFATEEAKGGGASRTQTIYQKREMSAKEQEKHADAMAAKGQWAFALVAYKEASKTFPDSADLKRKIREAQDHVDKEAVDDAVSRVQRLTAEDRYETAYDIIGRAIKTAGSEELKNRARKALQEVQASEKIARARTRNRVIVTLVIVLVLGLSGALAYLHFRSASSTTATAAKPPEQPQNAVTSQPPTPAAPDTDQTQPQAPDTTAVQPEPDKKMPDNPYLRALIEAAKKREQQNQTGNTTTESPATPPETPVEHEPAEVTYTRVGFPDGSLTVSLPDYLKPQDTQADFVSFAGHAPDGTVITVSLSRGKTPATPDEVADTAQKNFVDPARYGGEITGRNIRFIPGAGKCPEIRGRYRSKDGTMFAMYTVVAPMGDYKNILTFTVVDDKSEEYFKEYTSLISSISMH